MLALLYMGKSCSRQLHCISTILVIMEGTWKLQAHFFIIGMTLIRYTLKKNRLKHERIVNTGFNRKKCLRRTT